MATYRIPFLNAGSDITDPVITVDNMLRNIDPDTMTVGVTVRFTITVGESVSTFGLQLDVSVPSLNYNKPALDAIVMIKLEEFIIP